MNDPTLPLTGLSSVRGKSVVARFDGGMLSSNGGVLALAEVERRLRVAERLARCIDDPRCSGSGRPQPGRHDRLPHEDDRRRLRGRQRRQPAALRSGLQDGPGCAAFGSGPGVAIDDLPAGEPARRAPAGGDGAGDGRPLLRLLPAGAEADRARHRRHLRRRAWRPAIAPVQCPLRRIRLPADRGVRWRGPVRQRGAATGQAAERGRDPRSPAPPGAGDPDQLAEHPHPDPGRRPLLRPAGH